MTNDERKASLEEQIREKGRQNRSRSQTAPSEFEYSEHAQAEKHSEIVSILPAPEVDSITTRIRGRFHRARPQQTREDFLNGLQEQIKTKKVGDGVNAGDGGTRNKPSGLKMVSQNVSTSLKLPLKRAPLTHTRELESLISTEAVISLPNSSFESWAGNISVDHSKPDCKSRLRHPQLMPRRQIIVSGTAASRWTAQVDDEICQSRSSTSPLTKVELAVPPSMRLTTSMEKRGSLVNVMDPEIPIENQSTPEPTRQKPRRSLPLKPRYRRGRRLQAKTSKHQNGGKASISRFPALLPPEHHLHICMQRQQPKSRLPVAEGKTAM